MKIESAFELGQTIHLASVSDQMEHEPCPICDGTSHINATDEVGGTHRLDCPASAHSSRHRPDGAEQCRRGRIDVRMGSVLRIRVLTVGKITIEHGGLSGKSNMDSHAGQTFERHESVMCYETGIGTGNVWRLEASHGSRPFATDDEAREWGEAEVDRRNANRDTETP